MEKKKKSHERVKKKKRRRTLDRGKEKGTSVRNYVEVTDAGAAR